MGRISPTNPWGEGFVLREKFSVNSTLTVEVVIRTENEPEPRGISERHDVQRRVLEKMGWTWEDYIQLVRLLIRRKEIDVEDLSPAERLEYFEIYDGLAESFKRMIPPSQFGFLGGRPNKILPEKHEDVRRDVNQLLQSGIPKTEAYAHVARNYNRSSPATIKRICEDRRSLRIGSTT